MALNASPITMKYIMEGLSLRTPFQSILVTELRRFVSDEYALCSACAVEAHWRLLMRHCHSPISPRPSGSRRGTKRRGLKKWPEGLLPPCKYARHSTLRTFVRSLQICVSFPRIYSHNFPVKCEPRLTPTRVSKSGTWLFRNLIAEQTCFTLVAYNLDQKR